MFSDCDSVEADGKIQYPLTTQSFTKQSVEIVLLANSQRIIMRSYRGMGILQLHSMLSEVLKPESPKRAFLIVVFRLFTFKISFLRISTAPKYFQKRMDKPLSGREGCEVILSCTLQTSYRESPSGK